MEEMSQADVDRFCWELTHGPIEFHPNSLAPAKPHPNLNIYQRLAGIESEISRVVKDDQVGGDAGGYKYASHDAVTAALHPLFVKWGIFAHPTKDAWGIKPMRIAVGRGRDKRTIEVDVVWTEVLIGFVNTNNPTDCVATSAVGFGFGEKGPGISYSYGAKTAYLKALKLETGEQDLEGATDPSQNSDWPPPDRAQPPEDVDESGNKLLYRVAAKDGPPDCVICGQQIYKGQDIAHRENTAKVAHRSCYDGGDPPPPPSRPQGGQQSRQVI